MSAKEKQTEVNRDETDFMIEVDMFLERPRSSFQIKDGGWFCFEPAIMVLLIQSQIKSLLVSPIRYAERGVLPASLDSADSGPAGVVNWGLLGAVRCEQASGS